MSQLDCLDPKYKMLSDALNSAEEYLIGGRRLSLGETRENDKPISLDSRQACKNDGKS